MIRRDARRAIRPLAALAAGLLVVAACGGDEPRQLAGYTREPAVQVDGVALPDLTQDGEPFPLRAEPGQLLLTYFGYTNCPDVCPTTLADVRAALRRLGDDAGRIDLAMVTIDPERDTPVLADYVQSFVDDAHALATDDADQLRAVADPFGVSYSVVTNDEGEVEVSHSPQLYAVDDQGQLVITWQFGIGVDDLTADLEQLLEAQDTGESAA